jgi:hypothetical protein
MTIARIAAALGLVAATLLGGAATAAAATSPNAVPSPNAVAKPSATAKPNGRVDNVKVWAWHDVNVRQSCPSTSCPIDPVDKLNAGDWAWGLCWQHGETITAYGITNDIWVEISLEDGLARYVSAVFLTGDKYGNLPATAECPSVG